MSRLSRGLPEFLIITAIPVALAACSSGSSSSAVSAGGTGQAATVHTQQAGQTQQAGAGSGGGLGGNDAFCLAFAHAQADSLGVANGSKKAPDVSAEIQHVEDTAPAAIKAATVKIMDVELAFVNRDPSFAKKYTDPAYIAAHKTYHDWALANCPTS